MSAWNRARRHPWVRRYKPAWLRRYKPENYDDENFRFETEVCYCNDCDMRRHENLGGYTHVEIPVCEECNVDNAIAMRTQVSTTTCFVCHAPLETAVVLSFCAEALEQYITKALASLADYLCDRLREGNEDLIDILEEILEPNVVYTMEYLTDSFTSRILSNEDIEKEIEHYVELCTHHTSSTGKIAEMRALLEEFNRLKAAVFARAADAPAGDASLV
jgi:hypothetical protein